MVTGDRAATQATGLRHAVKRLLGGRLLILVMGAGGLLSHPHVDDTWAQSLSRGGKSDFHKWIIRARAPRKPEARFDHAMNEATATTRTSSSQNLSVRFVCLTPYRCALMPSEGKREPVSEIATITVVDNLKVLDPKRQSPAMRRRDKDASGNPGFAFGGFLRRAGISL